MSNTLDTDAPEHVRLDTEELSRLLDVVCVGLGVPSLWDGNLVRRLTTLKRGFVALSAFSEPARQWVQAINALLDSQVAHYSTEVRELNVLGVLLKQQPGNMPIAETHACLSLTCRAFSMCLKGAKISSTFFDGLTQLFNSQAKSWCNARSVLVKAGEATAHLDTTGLTDTCAKFLRSASVLRDECIYFPDLRPRSARGGIEGYVDATDENRSSDNSAAYEPEPRQATAFQTTPDLNLFEFQIVQQEHEPALNSYRLQNDWNSLTTSELMDCSRILLRQLRTPSTEAEWRAIRLHAACRLLSQIAQLGIEKLASLPIAECGTMHLNLKCGLISRDIMVIAPRTDRSTGQHWADQWLQTPVPPEILAVLIAAADIFPEARTIGDLLVGVGLTPTICHQLINSGRKEPRHYESLRIARSLRNFLLAGGIHPATVSRLLGDITIIPRAHHYYLSLDQSEIHSAINWWCEQVGLVQVATPERTTLVGSHKVRSFSEIQRAHATLQQENHAQKMTITTRSSLPDAINFHNTFMCRYVLQLNWALGARCQNLSKVTVAMLLGDPDHVIMADRTSDRYSAMRVCPLTSVLKRSRLNLVEHLLAMSKRLLAGGEATLAKELETHVEGTNPKGIGFPIIFTHKDSGLSLRPVTRADLKNVKENIPIVDLNEPRHFLITELDRRGVASVAIDALVGHHQTGAPPFGLGSGMSIKDFSVYTVNVLEQLHQELGLEELAGLGRSDPDRKKLCDIVLPQVVPLPSNKFLVQRIDIDDFNPPDIVLTEEDCPVSIWTMASLNKVRQLRNAYLQSDALKATPWGAVCFCLVIFDFVITPSELMAFYGKLALSQEQRIGELWGVEIDDSCQLPIGQRLLSNWTVDTLNAARRLSAPPTFELALQQMGFLLHDLDKHWPSEEHAFCLKRLQSISAHASLFELPPTARFSIFHKAPFIPLAELARIGAGTSRTLSKPVNALKSSTAKSNGFTEPLNIVKKWADRDLKLGEYRQRANDLIKELQQWSESTELDEADQWFLAFAYAELDNSPPYRRLSLPVLHKYLQISTDFFEHVRIAGDLPRTSEAWEGFLPLILSKRDQADGTHRWVGLHIGAWLHQLGIPIPKELRRGKVLPGNYRPHLSTYVTANELDYASRRVSESDISPPWESWMPVYLQAARFCPLRPAELRFLRACDVSSGGQHLHIQSSGHIHLKTTTSKGLISIPKQLQNMMLHHKQRRSESPAGLKASLFVPSRAPDYSGLDKSIGVARLALKEVTGRSDFRMYDLRACSISDLIFDVSSNVKKLVRGTESNAPIYNACALEDRFKRCAFAAREARQTSCLTALRYYNLGGLIESRYEINRSIQDLKPSAKYLAAIEGRSAEAVHSRRYRVAHGAKPRRSTRHAEPQNATQSDCAIRPTLEPASGYLQLSGHRPILARMLELGGLTSFAAADEAGVSVTELQAFGGGKQSALIQAGIQSIHETATKTDSTWFFMLEGLSKWAFHHRRELTLSLAGRPRGFRAYGSKISFRDSKSLTNSTHLWAGLHALGIRPIVLFSDSVLPSDRISIRLALQAIGSEVAATTVARQRFAAMRFKRMDPNPGSNDLAKHSNHQQGKMGRLVVAAICLAVDTTTSTQHEKQDRS